MVDQDPKRLIGGVDQAGAAGGAVEGLTGFLLR